MTAKELEEEANEAVEKTDVFKEEKEQQEEKKLEKKVKASSNSAAFLDDINFELYIYILLGIIFLILIFKYVKKRY